MAVLNIRVDDQVRDELKDFADAEGVHDQRVRPQSGHGGNRPRVRAQKKIKATFRRPVTS